MRPLLVVPALLLAVAAPPTDRLGTGIATVEVADGVRLDFFAAPGNRLPVATVHLREDAAAQTLVLDPPNALRPITLWLDYALLAFRVHTVAADAFEVVVDEATGQTRWLRAQPGLVYKPWAQYLVENVTAFDRLDAATNPLRAAPDPHAAPLPYEAPGDRDCFAATEVRGEWVRVTYAELCMPDDAPPLDGWVRWRDADALLIGYGLAC